jgi:2-dehydro-3-deoxygluconokinase
MASPPASRAGQAPELITLGECLIAFVGLEPAPLADTQTFARHVAGAEANVAVGLARLGRQSAFIGRVGDDPLGLAIERQLRGEGVDVSCLRRDPAGTGLIVRDSRAVGPADVVYRRSGSAGAQLSPDDLEAAAELFRGARWLHLSGITPALSRSAQAACQVAIDLARVNELSISFDVNLRWRLWSADEAVPVLRELVRQVDVVFAGWEEGALLAGSEPSADPQVIVDALASLGEPGGQARITAVLKLGPEGALMREAGSIVAGPGLRVERVVDPVGAGDAFCAGWICAQLEGLDAAATLALANACGAAAVGALGDQTGLPSREEAERILGGRLEPMR